MQKNLSHRRPARMIMLALAAVLAVFAPTLTVASPAQAAAPACVSPRHDANGEDAGRMYVTANLKAAPYAHCGNVVGLNPNDIIYLHCWTYNQYGNQWWWVRVAGTNTYGWMSDSNFTYEFQDDDGDGTVEHAMCPV